MDQHPEATETDVSMPERPPSGVPGTDEVVATSADEAELDASIEDLLRRRRLRLESIDLARQANRSERRFESLFRSLPDPAVVVAPDGTTTEVNEAFCRTFEFGSDAVVGRSVTDLRFTPVESVERVLLDADADADGKRSATVRWEGDHNEALVTELNAETVAGFGEDAERIGIFRDVTERVNRQRELEGQNERLDVFAGMISHDLRNPLGIAQGYLDVALETRDSEHFAKVAEAHDRIDRLIEDVLTLAREGRAAIESEEVPIAIAAERAWGHADTGDATLEIETATTVDADEGRLHELFGNLSRNAVEHGGGDVTVRVGQLPAGFFVEDDGPGIPPDEREQVFEHGHTTGESGTGFGLSIVATIADVHGWETDVEEGTDGGARFEIDA
jgi:PAS domain S-box-containing protein